MARGRLRIYLGAAPGVGKTYDMLNEGWRRAQRGTDVVVGYVETHGRANTAAQLRDLEVVPRRTIVHRDRTFEEMDVDAVLARRPDVALVDELAHTNVPGSRNEKRWQDVAELLDAGIEVVSTLNIQHLVSLNDVVEEVTGVRQRETIPDEIVRAADQVELVDMTPEALRRRMTHGNIYAREKVDSALANYFRPGNLGALRELALLWVADRVDEALRDYRRAHGIEQQWETRERVVVAITGAPSGDALIRRAARMARRSHADLLAVHVRPTDGRSAAPSDRVDEYRQLVADLGGEYHEVVDADPAAALVRFARAENATQLVLGASQRSRWAELSGGNVINRVIRHSGDIDVHVISTGETPAAAGRPRAITRRPPALSGRRRAAGWMVATIGAGAVTLLLTNTRSVFEQPSRFLLYQALVLAAAAIGGVGPALLAAGLASLSLNWYFTPPFHTWTIDEPDNVLALVIFTIVGCLVAVLVNGLARRSSDADRARTEAETLARLAAGLLGEEDPLPAMLDRMRTTLELAGIGVYAEADEPVALAGELSGSIETFAMPNGEVRLAGTVGPDDRRIVEAFTAQLATVLDRRRLALEAARAAALAEADALRTALLRAVSHDLRTPLASIKASVTSLQQQDVRWSDAERKEFLATIDEETDRLDALVANLLDASRLQAGVIEPAVDAVAVDEVVPAALASISGLDADVEIDVPDTVPLVRADPGLLERAIANIVANAAKANRTGFPVLISARPAGEDVEVRVVDHGPGVAPEQRAAMFQPFQRLGDTGGGGVGLGLAVAKGIVDALGGSLVPEDTPGGGLTMTLRLPRADGS